MARLNRSIDELIELVLENRERRIEQRRKKHQEAVREFETSEAAEPDAERAVPKDPSLVRVVLFGAQTPFMESLMAMLHRYTEAAFFEDPEETISFVADYTINNVILDIDPPSDWEAAADVFAAIRIINPEAGLFICTKNPQSMHARMLRMRGGSELTKPLFFKEVEQFVNHCVHKSADGNGDGAP